MPKRSKYQKKLHFRPFEEAREFVRTLGLNSYGEWKEYAKIREKDQARAEKEKVKAEKRVPVGN